MTSKRFFHGMLSERGTLGMILSGINHQLNSGFYINSFINFNLSFHDQLPTDCAEILVYNPKAITAIYTIYPLPGKTSQVSNFPIKNVNRH